MSHEVLEAHWIRHACKHWYCWRVTSLGPRSASGLLRQPCPECIVKSEGEEWKATLGNLLKKLQKDFN